MATSLEPTSDFTPKKSDIDRTIEHAELKFGVPRYPYRTKVRRFQGVPSRHTELKFGAPRAFPERQATGSRPREEKGRLRRDDNFN